MGTRETAGSLFPLILLLGCAVPSAESPAADEAASTAVAVVLELRDGTRLEGKSATATLALMTEGAGQVDVRLDGVQMVQFLADGQSAVVRFLNGDVLRGKSVAEELTVQTEEGSVTKPLSVVKSIWPTWGPDVLLSAGLIAYYPMWGDAMDLSGGGHHGAVCGPLLTQDRFGRPEAAYEFDGVDDYIEVPGAPDLDSSQSVTVSAWIRLMDAHADQHIVRQGDFRTRAYRFGLVLFGDDLQFNTHDGMCWHAASLRDAIRLDEWHQVAGVFDGEQGDMYLYVDGAEVDRQGGAKIPHAKGQPIVIGAEHFGKLGKFFRGCIDDVRVYDRALSGEEMRRLWLLESRLPGDDSPAEEGK